MTYQFVALTAAAVSWRDAARKRLRPITLSLFGVRSNRDHGLNKQLRVDKKGDVLKALTDGE